MLNRGNKITKLRKKKGWLQSDKAKALGIKIDFLLRQVVSLYDKEIFNRRKCVQKMQENNINVIHTYIQNCKIKQAFATK